MSQPVPRRGGSHVDRRFADRLSPLIAALGVTGVPDLLLGYQGRLGLTSNEVIYVGHVLRHRRGGGPSPWMAVSDVVTATGAGERSVRDWRAALVEKGYLSLRPRGESGPGTGGIDVGASELVASGSITLRSGVVVTQIKPHSMVLDDGSELHADLIVYATGYGSMNGYVAHIVSQAVADEVGKCWGLGSGTTKDPAPWEGELRNMCKPTRKNGLRFHGGNLHQSRHYSQFLALQIKARMEGIGTPVYKLAEVHHTS